jgi:hypothetical protein
MTRHLFPVQIALPLDCFLSAPGGLPQNPERSKRRRSRLLQARLEANLAMLARLGTVPESFHAESFFSRLRRAEIGIHRHVAGPYLSAYASEMAWRENNRRISNGEQYLIATDAALAHPVSRQWKGYWQRSVSSR